MLLVESRSLLDRYRRGDREALTAVFEHYAPKVGRWVSGGFVYKVGDTRHRFRGFASPADAHDCIHEVFRRAFEASARTQYSGLSPFEGYLLAITRNVVLKKLRVRDRDQPDAADALDTIPSSDPSPEEMVARSEQQQLVRSFLSSLSDERRNFVRLRFTEQLAQMTVAERLGWGRKKVRLEEAAVRRGLTRFLLSKRGRAELGEIAHDNAR